MAALTDADIDAATERGRVTSRREPRAAGARYDRHHGRIVIELTNGCTFSFPARLAQGLETATDEQLAEVEVLGAGYGLHWEALDADLSVPGLLAGLFGTKAYMARHAGQATSPAKAAAARANGAKRRPPTQICPATLIAISAVGSPETLSPIVIGAARSPPSDNSCLHCCRIAGNESPQPGLSFSANRRLP